jgi:hypothetical protein
LHRRSARASWPRSRRCTPPSRHRPHRTVFLFQASNDYDLAPNKAIAAARRHAGKAVEEKVYPRYGWSGSAGHSFAYKGVQTWFPDVSAFLNTHCPG